MTSHCKAKSCAIDRLVAAVQLVSLAVLMWLGADAGAHRWLHSHAEGSRGSNAGRVLGHSPDSRRAGHHHMSCGCPRSRVLESGQTGDEPTPLSAGDSEEEGCVISAFRTGGSGATLWPGWVMVPVVGPCRETDAWPQPRWVQHSPHRLPFACGPPEPWGDPRVSTIAIVLAVS